MNVATRGEVLDFEPVPEVRKELERALGDLATAIGRTRISTLGTGSMLAIANHTPKRSMITMTIDYPSDQLKYAEYMASAGAGWLLQRELRTRANDTGALGGHGNLWLRFAAPSDDDLVAAVPMIFTEINAAKPPTRQDVSAAIGNLDELAGNLGLYPEPVDFGLRQLLFEAPGEHSTIRVSDRPRIHATLEAAAIDDIRRRWRTGHVRIGISGGFSDDQVATLERTVRASLDGWTLCAPLTPQHFVRTPRAARIARSNVQMLRTIIIGQVLEAEDDANALALDIACRGPIKARIKKVVEEQELSGEMTHEREGRQFVIHMWLSHCRQSEKTIAAVTEALGVLVAEDQRARSASLWPRTVGGRARQTALALGARSRLERDRGGQPCGHRCGNHTSPPPHSLSST